MILITCIYTLFSCHSTHLIIIDNVNHNLIVLFTVEFKTVYFFTTLCQDELKFNQVVVRATRECSGHQRMFRPPENEARQMRQGEWDEKGSDVKR